MKSDFILKKTEKVWSYTIPSFDDTGLVKTGFSTRVGEVVRGDRDSALEFCKHLGFSPQNFGFCGQVHGNKVVDACSGDLEDADGLMTDEKGLALITFYADCTPLYFLDTKNRAIATSHAGWKGTVAKIGAKTLRKMHKAYGTRPQDCYVAIGPCIGKCCFEVDAPVANQFERVFGSGSYITKNRLSGKYHIDLAKVNEMTLKKLGVPKENIYRSAICTSCNTDIVYSYRREGGTQNRMAAVIMLV